MINDFYCKIGRNLMCKALNNIIIVYDNAAINGGAAKVAIQSAIALSKLDYNVYFFSATGEIDEGLRKSNVNVKCLGIDDINTSKKIYAVKDGIWNKKVKKEFSSFINNFSIDNTVIHIHGWVKALTPVVFDVANKKNFKTLVTLHDYFTLCPNGGFYNYKKQVICQKAPMSLSCIFCNCDKRNYVQKLWRICKQFIQDKYVRNNPLLSFISISEGNERVVKKYTKSQKYYRVYNPIEASPEYNAGKLSNIFVFVGRLSHEKGIDIFCEAITQVQSSKKIDGIVVGDGPLFEEMKCKYRNILFVGWKRTTEVKKITKTARMLILPSKWYEGAPLTVLDAMFWNTPCIVSDCTFAREIVIDGINGFIFKSNDVASLKEKIIKSLDDGLVSKFKYNIKNEFDFKKYSEDYHISSLIKVYEDILIH